jgi:hypothetical protein
MSEPELVEKVGVVAFGNGGGAISTVAAVWGAAFCGKVDTKLLGFAAFSIGFAQKLSDLSLGFSGLSEKGRSFCEKLCISLEVAPGLGFEA